MADEIRARESEAKEVVSEAKAGAAQMLASARTAAELSIKEARQRSHRLFREQVKKTEGDADAEAAKIVERGRNDSEGFYASSKPKVKNVTDWLVKEVMSAYGDS
jgi:vacuolar-type H+-ATPase subunit H